MILGSHNSWSYLSPKKWYLKLFRFAAQCQDVDIATQYLTYKVRCFDLRLQFDDEGHTKIVHGSMTFDYNWEDVLNDLAFLNIKKDCYVRVIHDVRTESAHTPLRISYFQNRCKELLVKFPNIVFWNGRNLYNGEKDYVFKPSTDKITCEELYSSVRYPKYLDDWFPRLYALIMNHKNRKKGTDKDILLIDFVNYK